MALGCMQDIAPSVPQSLEDTKLNFMAAIGTVRPGTGKAPFAADVYGSDGGKYMVPIVSLRHPHEHSHQGSADTRLTAAFQQLKSFRN